MTYQLGVSLLDAMVLSIISREDAYGYSISQQLKQVTEMKDSALYPVLRRLQQAGYLGTYDQPCQGRNRKYYYITDLGKDQQSYYVGEWKKFRKEVEGILLGGEENEQG